MGQCETELLGGGTNFVKVNMKTKKRYNLIQSALKCFSDLFAALLVLCDPK